MDCTKLMKLQAHRNISCALLMTCKNPLHVDNGSLEYTILSVNMEKEKRYET